MRFHDLAASLDLGEFVLVPSRNAGYCGLEVIHLEGWDGGTHARFIPVGDGWKVNACGDVRWVPAADFPQAVRWAIQCAEAHIACDRLDLDPY
jgi:hypothetical protein